MKHWFLLLLFTSVATAQTNQQLIDSIIKVNELHSVCVGSPCKESDQYKNFQKLKSKLTNNELLELTTHRNGVIRMYATRECIDTNQGDVVSFLIDEIKKGETVEEFNGCIMGPDYTANIVYHDYWNKVRIEARDKVDYNNEELVKNAMAERVQKDPKMLELDSLVLAQDNAYWLLYSRAFSNRKFTEQFLPRIEELAFKHHNAFALDHLLRYYHEQYKDKIHSYWHSKFPKVKFKGHDAMYHYITFIQILLEEGDSELKNIAINKLKHDRSWESEQGWFESVLSSYGLSLEDIKTN